jgi:hypothetical protein
MLSAKEEYSDWVAKKKELGIKDEEPKAEEEAEEKA